MTIEWMDDPEWIHTSIWGPFHFYFTALSLWIWNDPVYSPAILHILFSCLTLVPFYHFTRREFSEKGAMIASILLAFSPLLFRNSFMALSETPYLFLLACCLNAISLGIKNDSNRLFLLAGSFITLASGFRYEAWLLMPVLALVIWMKNNFKHALLFGMAALIFPMIWMIQNYLEKGNAFYSLQGNYDWTLQIMNNNEGLDLGSYVRRLWFFPFSWMICLGPLAAFLILISIRKTYLKNSEYRSIRFWAIPFFILFIFFEYNCFKGVLLLQHRFTGTLVLASLPFIALFFDKPDKRKTQIAWASVLLMLGLSFLYNMKGVTPFSRLSDQSYATIIKKITPHIKEGSSLIVDFTDWESTYFVALESRLHPKDIVLFYPTETNGIPKEVISKSLKEHNEGVVLFKKNSELSNALLLQGELLSINCDGHRLVAENIFENGEVLIVKWVKQLHIPHEVHGFHGRTRASAFFFKCHSKSLCAWHVLHFLHEVSSVCIQNKNTRIDRFSIHESP